MAAREGFDKGSGILVCLHGDSCQLQTSNPTFCASFQCRDIYCREIQSHRLVEKFGGFGGDKTQIGSAQFCQLAAGT